MKIDHLMTVGSVDKRLRVTFRYEYHDNNDQYPTIREPNPGKVVIYPSFAISISRDFDDGIYIVGSKYFAFITLLERAVKLISDHMYDLFPDVSRIEFEADNRALEQFKLEHTLSTDGMDITPCVYVNETNECFPGIQYQDNRTTFKFPLEDAIPIVKMFSVFDPYAFGMSLLRIIGKIE